MACDAIASCICGDDCVNVTCLIRTCLWLRAGRWASGQEAGQPPGSKTPYPDRRSEATGLHPFSTDGRGLKQRRSGLFWSHAGPPKVGLPKRLVLLAGRADGVFLFRYVGCSKGSLTRKGHLTPRSSRYGAPAGSAIGLRVEGIRCGIKALPHLASPSRGVRHPRTASDRCPGFGLDSMVHQAVPSPGIAQGQWVLR